MNSTKGIRPRRASGMGTPSGGRREGRAEPAALEMLEPRMLLDAGDPTALDGDVLQVYGTNAADVITIDAGEADDTGHRDVSVTINGVTEEFSDVIASVEVRGYAGGDDIRMNGDLKLVAHGGLGADYIRGGKGRDELHGNEGDDTLEGGDERSGLSPMKSPPAMAPPPSASPDQGAPDGQVEDASGLFGSSTGGDWIYGGDGEDEIDGGAGHDRLFGGDGDDLIEGGAGNDTIYGGDGADEMYGDGGDDTIHGGKKKVSHVWEDKGDTIYGGAGNDVLSGGFGNDRLYGGYGADELDGGIGMDALFALHGTDTIDGGWGSDRIYVSDMFIVADYDGDDTIDAAFLIQDGEGTWTQDELSRLDDAIKLMHEANGTNATIQTAYGYYVTFVRGGDEGDVYADNYWGIIHIYDGAVELDDAGKDWFGRTIVHMLGNNWDTENPDWEDFLELSGWTQDDHDGEDGWSYTYKYLQEWWYETDSEFARSYGKEHPMDDWGTCIEAYFYGDNYDGTVDEDHSWMEANMPDKFAFVDDFLTNFEGVS